MITSITVLLLAGGSILLLPLLVSGAALPTKVAVTLSLLVVTLLALGNVGPYIRRRQVAVRPALVLGLPALAGSWIGGSVVKAGLIPEQVQLGIFTAAALLASWLMVRPHALAQPSGDRRSAGWPVALAGQGVLVGLLTGIAGVGGGFAIVPALVLLSLNSGGFCRPGPLASSPSTADLAVDRRWRHWGGHWPATCASPARTEATPGVRSPADRIGPAHRLRSLATP